MGGWQTHSSRVVYENRWIRVREDRVTGPSGDGIYGVVQMRHPAVFVVALDERGRVCLVTLERYATGTISREVPAGGTDGEAPEDAARRELTEETGLTATDWTPIGEMDALNGVADAHEHVFLARGLQGRGDALSETQREEGISRVEWRSWPEVIAMIGDGEITDGETVAALMFAAVRLGRVG